MHSENIHFKNLPIFDELPKELKIKIIGHCGMDDQLCHFESIRKMLIKQGLGETWVSLMYFPRNHTEFLKELELWSPYEVSDHARIPFFYTLLNLNNLE